ncbi:MAG: DUF126 domain-containing protein [Nanopusillaceae archaeon]
MGDIVRLSFKGRPVIPGYVEGEAIIVDSISFYGDVRVEDGLLPDGRSISGKIIISRRGKGSTVGPYILYALKSRGLAPKAILLASRSDPVIVSGAVIAEVILVDSLPEDIVKLTRDGDRVRVYSDGSIIIA